jgi:hypothetical protein
LLAGKGPTFTNEYEYYADRHFLRGGAPVEPADHRPVNLQLRDGALLTEAAWADLDSFPLSTLEPYRSIVTRRSPAESRPPSIYQLVWQGRYYQLWQRPALPSTSILEHIPFGESNALPYCGNAQVGSTRGSSAFLIPFDDRVLVGDQEELPDLLVALVGELRAEPGDLSGGVARHQFDELGRLAPKLRSANRSSQCCAVSLTAAAVRPSASGPYT